MDSTLGKRIAGEITLSEEPGKTIRKWREEFGITTQELARHMGVSPSVVSDYESGRRKSPGTKTVKRIVRSLLELDEISGKRIATKLSGEKSETILSIHEFSKGVPAEEFVEIIEGDILTEDIPLDRNLHGYTVIDSLKAITTLTFADYHQVYGWSSERALIFTGVEYGRSPMIAIRAHPLKPAMVVYVRPGRVDPLALELARIERVILARTEIPAERLIDILEGIER